MILGYDLGGGGRTLLDGEHLRVEDDGSFELWRIAESAVVGRFAGRLPLGHLAELARLADAAAAEDSGSGSLPPGSRGEAWIAREAVTVVPEGRSPAGAWGALVEAVRPLLGELTRDPVAAVGVDVAADGRLATLRHRGSEALDVDPTSLRIEVACWTGYYDLVGTWDSPPLDLGTGSIGPGWSLELPLEHGFAARPGRVFHVKASFDVRVAGGVTRLQPTVAPPMDEDERSTGVRGVNRRG